MTAVRRQLRESAQDGRWAGFGEPVQRFMDDYEASTVPHVETNPHRDPREGLRRHPNGVVSSVHPRFDPMEGEREELFVQWLNAGHPGQGHGTATMRDLTRMADRHGVTMTLEPNRPPGHRGPGPDDAGLERWYGKHGFRMGEYGIMTRQARRLRESRADALIRQKLEEGTVSRVAFGERHYWRKPEETLAGRQLPDEAVTRWLPDSYTARARGAGFGTVSMVTKTGRGRRQKTASRPLMSTQRTAHPDGSYTEKTSMDGGLARAMGSGSPLYDRTRNAGIRRHPRGDVFSVVLSKGVLRSRIDGPPKEGWKQTFDKYGLGDLHQHLRSAGLGPHGPYQHDGEHDPLVALHYEGDPRPAIHVARLLSQEPGLSVEVEHHRKFESNDHMLKPTDRIEYHEVGTIDHNHDITPDGKVKYKHSIHALMDHAASTGQPHRCGTRHNVTGSRDVCGDTVACSNARSRA